MKKKWIRIFCLNTREWLEEELNKFINQYDDCEITIQRTNYDWVAYVRYSYPESPTYSKPESKE